MSPAITVSPDACICGNPACVISYGLCHCTCGEATPIAKYTIAKKRCVAGKPKLFAPRHHLRKPREVVPVHSDPFVRTLPLGDGLFAVVDEVEYAKVSGFLYHAHHEDGNVYAVRDIPGKQKMRLHWDILWKPAQGRVIDHIDGDGLNNRRLNLRDCPIGKNNLNRKLNRHNKSGYSGVRFDEKRQIWIVTISINGRRKHLGVFRKDEKHKAVECRLAAEKIHYGEYAPKRG